MISLHLHFLLPILQGGLPTGHSSPVWHAWDEHLWGYYLQRIPVPRTYIIWSGPFWTYFWGSTLILSFWMMGRFMNRAHRQHRALYGVESYAGSILERIGKVSMLSWFLIFWLTAFSIYYLVVQTARGYRY